MAFEPGDVPGAVPNEDEADPAGEPGDEAASEPSGTRPRNTGAPSADTAITATRAGWSVSDVLSPGCRGVGSQTNVTLVLPFSPRDVPIQERMTRDRAVTLLVATLASADFTAGASGGFGGASDRADYRRL